MTMPPTYENLFKEVISDPLQRVVGKPLRSVTYSVLYHDAAFFDLDSPNTSGGCQIVRLHFADAAVGLDWDWKGPFRPDPGDEVSPPIAYHLTALSESVRPPIGNAESDPDEYPLQPLDATAAIPWRAVQGERLERIVVWGVPLPNERYSPQAVELQFPSACVVIAVGMTMPMCVGDGDELFVFGQAEWELRNSDLDQEVFVPFWSCSHEEGSENGTDRENGQMGPDESGIGDSSFR